MIKIVFKHYRVEEICANQVPKKGKPKRKWLTEKGNGLYRSYSRGGKTTCQIILAEGEAICSMSDQFCYKEGRELAFQRALKEAPEEMREEIKKTWLHG